MSKPAGAQQPSESQKAKALWAMNAAKDRKDEFYDSVRKENILEQETDKTGGVRRQIERHDHCFGQSVELRGKSVARLVVGWKVV